MHNPNIPNGWKLARIGNILERLRKPVDVVSDEQYREIGIRSHGKGLFHKDARTGASLGNKRVFWIEPDCFVVNIVFAWEQAVAKTTIAEKGMIASHRFPMYKPVPGKLDLDYILYFFKTPYGKHLLGLASPGGAGRNKTLGQKEFDKLSLPLPPYSEQRKIAEILNTWDETITKAEQLIAALQARKKGLIQRLLFVEPESSNPALRLMGYSEDWEIKKLGDVFSRISRKNEKNCTNVLTASAQLGLVNQLDYYNRSIAGKSLLGYYLIKKGEFAYNRGRSTGYPYGATKRLEFYDEGVLSTLYICFSIKNKKTDLGGFYRHYFESDTLNRGLYQITQEGARNHGLLNINVRDFFNLRISVPKVEEQRALANFFELVDKEISLAQQKLSALQQQKKGLMQRLLTGEVRVSV